MPEAAVRVEGLWKEYTVGSAKRHSTFYDFLSHTFRVPFARTHAFEGHARPGNDFCALRDVTFDVARGEVLGVVGRNGAGKSTLLKVLSRITAPTRGRVTLRGRVASLLEVGTGFHPELTGRDNIELNATILGMGRREIRRKFDQIVEFSGVERFLDTPVKRYSSGMYVRLAFAVAAHVEADILLIDEVLAVGDAEFQKRCLGMMGQVARDGRTVLFVSHNMPAVSRLCQRAVFLDRGTVVMDGPAPDVVSAYLRDGRATSCAREWSLPGEAPAGDVARLRAVRVKTRSGDLAASVDIRQPLRFEIEYEVMKAGHVLLSFFNVFSDTGVHVLEVVDVDSEWRRRPRPQGRYVVTARIPGNLLAEGLFLVSAGLTTLDPPVVQFNQRDVIAFHVVDSGEGDSARGDWAGTLSSAVRPLLEWTTHFNGPTLEPIRPERG
jgi:lipopolysaccharide transport system ATP-binding protein